MLRWKLLPAIGAMLMVLALPCISSAQTALVKADSLSLRKKPDAAAERVRALATHEPVTVKTRKGEWAEVETPDGEKGWVLEKHLSRTPFVSVNVDKLNVRRGPADSYAIVMKVIEHYPLRVIKRSEGWLRVEDFDGDGGWVMAQLVSDDPYVITKLDSSNVRTSPGTDSKVVFTAERGVILKVLEEKDGWLKVKHADGDEGWISAKIVFGWQPS